jgi:flagellar biosynthesis/type III secretory pathway protein FliH
VAVWLEGKDFLDKARHALEKAKEEAAASIAEEKHRAYQEGLNAGIKEAIELVTRTKLAVENYKTSLQAGLAELVIQIMQEMLGDIDPAEAAYLSVAKALKNVDIGPDMHIAVAPGLAEGVRARLRAAKPQDAFAGMSVVEDAKLPPRGCKLVSDLGTIDLSLDGQLEILAENLRSHAQQGAGY